MGRKRVIGMTKKGKRAPARGRKPIRMTLPKTALIRQAPPQAEGGAGRKGKEPPDYARQGRGRSPTTYHQHPEVSSQSGSDSGSDSAWQTWLANTKTKISPLTGKERHKGTEIPLTDWRKIQIACADWAPSDALAFPVRVTDGGQRVHSPLSPKDIRAIVKAITDKGLNAVMVSTLIDGFFGGDDLLPFDIKQICRLIFDGAGMIVFKQEWEENCARQISLK